MAQMNSRHMVQVFGAAWCGDCWRAKGLLERRGIQYEWRDITDDPDAYAYVLKVNGGRRIIPVLLFPDGSTLTEPSNAQLDAKLRHQQLGGREHPSSQRPYLDGH